MLYGPTRRPIRTRLAHAARRVALTAAIRVLDCFDAATGTTATPAAVASSPTLARCCAHGLADHDALGCNAAVGFPGMPAARCDCLQPAPPVEAAGGPALFTAADLPPVDVIEAAAAEYDEAAELARTADRSKRKARKLLDRLPVGSYGRATVERVPSARETPDLPEIARIFQAHGLGEVPMRPCAPTLKVTVAPAVEVPMAAVAVAA